VKTLSLALFLLLICGCDRNKDQWVLQSYDKDKGYVFVKDGIQYEASCFGTGNPVLGVDNHPDPNPDAMPPTPAYQQNDCDEVLQYLHKPVPHFRLVYGSLLVYEEKDRNWKLEFEIKHAK
jgi:hypothetical protein